MSSTVTDHLTPRPKTVLAGAPAEEVAALLARENVRDVLVLDAGGVLVGVIDQVPVPGTLARDACRPITEVLAPDMDATAALRQMERSDVLRLPVVAADGTLVGVIARTLLAERLSGT